MERDDWDGLKAPYTEAVILDAVESSGYPLQFAVTQVLSETARGYHRFQEEWSYVDRDTQESRTLDLMFEERLYDPLPAKTFSRG